MKQAIITLDEHGVPVHIAFDGQPPVPIDSFVLLSNVPSDPSSGHILAYGNSDKVGKLLYNFWIHSAKWNPEGALVIEMVCRDIVKTADSAREPRYIMSDEETKKDFH